MGSVWIHARCNKVLGALASSHFCEIDPLIILMNSEEPLPTSQSNLTCQVSSLADLKRHFALHKNDIICELEFFLGKSNNN